MHRYKEWALTLFRWDGLLPLAVFAAPEVVAFLFPGRPAALELTCVVVPVAAFTIRFVIGTDRSRNGQLYAWQFAMFLIALFVLFVFDAMLIMAQIIEIGVPLGVWLTLVALYMVYLGLMAIAIFPLRIRMAEERTDASCVAPG